MMNESWKSFWLGTCAAVIIALVAGFYLNSINPSSGEKFSTSSTRIDK